MFSACICEYAAMQSNVDLPCGQDFHVDLVDRNWQKPAMLNYIVLKVYAGAHTSMLIGGKCRTL